MFLIKEFQHLQIKMEDVKSATNDFASNKLIGRGGFGLVYKGELCLPDGIFTVAFKRLHRNFGQGNTEFWREIMMLSKYKHENLISLIHFCILGDERILVYDYASRGSLDRYLSDPRLSWIQRLKICLGVARALNYLHDPADTQQRLLHRDIKSANILLDDDWNAKVSDFGLSKFGVANQSRTYQVSNAVGTPGYCDPLYHEMGFLSKESDVYSFGVVLFEVLCGKLCCEYRNDKLVCILVHTWKECFAEKRMDEIICPDLKDQINQDSLMTFSSIAYQCLDRDHKKRPTMIQIVEKLEVALAQCYIDVNVVKPYHFGRWFNGENSGISTRQKSRPLARRTSSVLPVQSSFDNKMSATKLIMPMKRLRLEEDEEITNDQESERKITSSRAGVSALVRGAKVMIIQTMQRFLVPIITPMIHSIMKEQMGLAKHEILSSMKENLAIKGSTLIPNLLKLQFRSKISLPVFAGKPILGVNETILQIALVDSLNEQIVTTGSESMAKVEIVGFSIGDDENNDESWTFEDFQLQGITFLQLKEGICFVDQIFFRHNSANTKAGWYKLGARFADDALMNVVEVATTEAFQMTDKHFLYNEDYPHPCLFNTVCHLRHIHYKGTRYKRLKDAGVNTVANLLELLYKDAKRLEHILEIEDSSEIWVDIVKNAQASTGLYVYLDLRNNGKSGVVLDAKLQLKALIVEPHQYIPVNQLSSKEKEDNQDLVMYASNHIGLLDTFENEAYLIEYLQRRATFTSLPRTNKCYNFARINDAGLSTVKIESLDTCDMNNCELDWTPPPVLDDWVKDWVKELVSQ